MPLKLVDQLLDYYHIFSFLFYAISCLGLLFYSYSVVSMICVANSDFICTLLSEERAERIFWKGPRYWMFWCSLLDELLFGVHKYSRQDQGHVRYMPSRYTPFLMHIAILAHYLNHGLLILKIIYLQHVTTFTSFPLLWSVYQFLLKSFVLECSNSNSGTLNCSLEILKSGFGYIFFSEDISFRKSFW